MRQSEKWIYSLFDGMRESLLLILGNYNFWCNNGIMIIFGKEYFPLRIHPIIFMDKVILFKIIQCDIKEIERGGL